MIQQKYSANTEINKTIINPASSTPCFPQKPMKFAKSLPESTNLELLRRSPAYCFSHQLYRVIFHEETLKLKPVLNCTIHVVSPLPPTHNLYNSILQSGDRERPESLSTQVFKSRAHEHKSQKQLGLCADITKVVKENDLKEFLEGKLEVYLALHHKHSPPQAIGYRVSLCCPGWIVVSL